MGGWLTLLTAIGCIAASTLFCGCSSKERGAEERESEGAGKPMNAAYYWSTVFSLDSAQQAFIRNQHIGRIYLRYFDVVMKDGKPMPNATVQFAIARPKGVEMVPTIYIVNSCMETEHRDLDSLLLSRILQMSETHDMGPIREIQLDCDWTKQTCGNYFALLERLKERAKAHDIRLSATIRLHQLSQPTPPVDRGVLMMYNTGDVTKFDGTDPILDMRDVKPYLRYLKDYDLPLSTAYPVFAWQVVFRKGDGKRPKVKGLRSKVVTAQRLQSEAAQEGLRSEGAWRYIGILHRDDYLPVLPDDSIVVRQPTPDMVRQARQAVDSLRPDANREVILYDISRQNIQRIKQYHYEKVIFPSPAGSGTRAE